MDYREVEQIKEKSKAEGVKLNRQQIRSLLKKGKHKPVYTKKWSTERGKTVSERKEIQMYNVKSRFENMGIWENRKWYFEPYKTQLITEMRKQMELIS